jgi:4-hydroxy-3-methylbut-2-enyl diphosphate reductase
VDNASELKPGWVAGKRVVGVTAGASAPEVLVKQVVDRLRQLGGGRAAEAKGIAEKVVFPLPKGLV